MAPKPPASNPDAMNLILHQFNTDLRHFRRWLLALWIAFAAELILAAPFAGGDVGLALTFFLMLLQIIYGLFILARVVQSDAVVGTTSGWMGRPLRRNHLFWAKTAFILLWVVLPKLGVTVILCLARSYSPAQTFETTAQLLLFVMALVGVAASLAALTRGLPQFFLAAGIVLGVTFAWAAIVSRHMSVPRQPGLESSAILVGFLFLVLCAAIVWLWQVLVGRGRQGHVVLAIGVLALPWVLTRWRENFLSPRTIPGPPLSASLITNAPQTAAAPGTQVLWSRLRVDGLPDSYVVEPEVTMAFFTPKGSDQAYQLPNGLPVYNAALVTNVVKTLQSLPPNLTSDGMDFSRRTPQALSEDDAYLKTIQQFFPAGTLWFGIQSWPSERDMLSPDRLLDCLPNRPLTGALVCDVELDSFRIIQAARVGLAPGTINVAPGQSVTIRKVTPDLDGVEVEFDEEWAAPIFSRDAYAYSSSQDQCAYVLYHPGSGEAFVSGQRMSWSATGDSAGARSTRDFTLKFPYPVLRERLGGVSMQDWLREARLCIFLPAYQGTSRQTMRLENLDLSKWAGNPAGGEALQGLQAIDGATLPDNPTDRQIAAYLDTIFFNIPSPVNVADRKKIQAKITAIGTRGLPILLRRLPLGNQLESFYVFPVLAKLATRDQLAELREALRHDPWLGEWFIDMHWDADARDVLVSVLGDHRLSFAARELCLAAGAKDPATYPDLAWRFVHLPNQQDKVLSALRDCPGFDVNAVVRNAWKLAQLGVTPPHDLAPAAAAQGLPDALTTAVVDMEGTAEGSRRSEQAATLAALTDYQGLPQAAAGWLSANLGRLRYDPGQQRYLLASPQ
jgi:hypothetical protein